MYEDDEEARKTLWEARKTLWEARSYTFNDEEETAFFREELRNIMDEE